MPETPLEVAGVNSKFEPMQKIEKKFRSISRPMVKIKVVLGVFRHAESKSGHYFVITLLIQRSLATL